MEYQDIINTLTEIVNNENIKKDGLKLIYEIDEVNHRKLDEHIFYSRKQEGEFIAGDVIEIESEGVIMQILKKK